MPKYSDGLITTSGLVISASNDGTFNNLLSNSLSTASLTLNTIFLNRNSVFGLIPFSNTLNFLYGSGSLAAFAGPAITILNTGSISDISYVSIKGGTLIGSASQSVGDISTFHISGTTSISSSVVSGSQFSLKVSAGNCFFGGNITSTGTVSCNNITAATATFSSGLSFSTPVSITDATQSTSSSTGSLITSGGVGIAKNLNVAGALTCNSITTGTLNLTSLSVSSLTVSSSLTTAALAMSGGLLKLSIRAPITTGFPYVVNFFGADSYVIIPINSSAPASMTVPSGSDGQLVILINQGSAILNLTINTDGAAGTVVVPAGGKLFLVWLSSTWLSIA